MDTLGLILREVGSAYQDENGLNILIEGLQNHMDALAICEKRFSQNLFASICLNLAFCEARISQHAMCQQPLSFKLRALKSANQALEKLDCNLDTDEFDMALELKKRLEDKLKAL
jgi:hypothetical protein